MYFFLLLGIMRFVIRKMGQEDFYGDGKFSTSQLIVFFKHQLKVKIRAKRRRLSSAKFSERWVNVLRLVHFRRANLEWHLEVSYG